MLVLTLLSPEIDCTTQWQHLGRRSGAPQAIGWIKVLTACCLAGYRGSTSTAVAEFLIAQYPYDLLLGEP